MNPIRAQTETSAKSPFQFLCATKVNLVKTSSSHKPSPFGTQEQMPRRRMRPTLLEGVVPPTFQPLYDFKSFSADPSSRPCTDNPPLIRSLSQRQRAAGLPERENGLETIFSIHFSQAHTASCDEEWSSLLCLPGIIECGWGWVRSNSSEVVNCEWGGLQKKGVFLGWALGFSARG